MEEYIVEESNSKRNVIVFIIIIIVLVALGYLFYNIKNKYTFNINSTVSYEIGDKLNLDIKKYVKSNIKEEKDYKLNLKSVPTEDGILTKTGKFNYTVKYKKLKKTGKIIVKDTKAPEVEVMDLYIEVGNKYEADDFILKCEDYSKPCNVDFEKNKSGDFKAKGEYKFNIVISDIVGNKVKKEVKLVIGDAGKNIIKSDLNIHHIDPNFEDYDNTLYHAYSKAIDIKELESDKYFKELREIYLSDLHDYIPELYANNLITESDFIKVYNKYNYVIGLTIRVKLDNQEVFYVSKENYHEN